MGRKNRNARNSHKYRIPKGRHFMYSTDELGNEASVVRYLGEQDGDYLYCYHPSGFPMWIHVAQLFNSASATQKRAA